MKGGATNVCRTANNAPVLVGVSDSRAARSTQCLDSSFYFSPFYRFTNLHTHTHTYTVTHTTPVKALAQFASFSVSVLNAAFVTVFNERLPGTSVIGYVPPLFRHRPKRRRRRRLWRGCGRQDNRENVASQKMSVLSF